MKKLLIISTVLLLMAVTTSVAYAALKSDDFNDTSRDTSMWNLYEDNHSKAWLNETGGRLEFRSTADADNGANYIANGWGLLPTNDFSLKIDFHHISTSGPLNSDSCVYLALIGDGSNYLTLEAGCYENNEGTHPYFYHERGIAGLNGDDFEIDQEEKVRTIDDGTLYISYDVSEDKLYLSYAGYWATNEWITIENFQDQWGSGIVIPYISGWADGRELASGDAYLDNFVVDSGTIVPEPATIAIFAIGAIFFRKIR